MSAASVLPVCISLHLRQSGQSVLHCCQLPNGCPDEAVSSSHGKLRVWC